MHLAKGKFVYSVVAGLFGFCLSTSNAQVTSGTLRGQVADQLGGLIIGAEVTVTNETGTRKSVVTDNTGNYQITNLAPGNYVLHVAAKGFETYERSDLKMLSGQIVLIKVTLSIARVEQIVTTSDDSAALNTEPENNAGAIVMHSRELDALPDDPDELASALQALAGPSAGPNGGQIFVDGFTNGHLPSKTSIREVRINQNPFSAEFDKIGLGRIEVFTKAGADRVHGQGSFTFGDESLNSRNPFITKRAPFQERSVTATLSGPIIVNKASIFVDFADRRTDGNTVINASILDSSLNTVKFNRAVGTPQYRTNITPRLDYQPNRKLTIVGRYSFSSDSTKGAGLSDLTLPSTAYAISNNVHTAQVVSTAVLNEKVINETRFQYISKQTKENPDSTEASLSVLDAFIGGGAQIGISSNHDNRWELQNSTLFGFTKHTIRIGGRLRRLEMVDVSSLNFGGTFIFGGGVAPQLDTNDQPVFEANGQPKLVTITSLERYRRTLLFQQRGLPSSQIRVLGGGATQFSIATGNPLTKISQVDLGAFIQDDWRLRPNFTVGLGLRYETQTNIHHWLDFAPRVSFAWAPTSNAPGTPKTVVRGGFGVFYDRVSENLTLQSNRFDGMSQHRFVVNNPDFFPSKPSVESLINTHLSENITGTSKTLRTPYTLQSAISVERQLPGKLTLSVGFINARTVHLLRSRNINAPLPGTFDSITQNFARPFPNYENIFEYESSGVSDQNQLVVNLKNQVNRHFSFFANYTVGRLNSDTDGADTFPSNQYDLSGEYGRSALDTRHRFVFVGVIDLPRGFSLNPFIVVRSGMPFNITTGRDANGDSLFNERPALAVSSSKSGVVATSYGSLDTNPEPGERIVPRNFGEGPNFIAFNLRISRTFGFGRSSENSVSKSDSSKDKKPSSDTQRSLNIYGNTAPKQHYQLTVSVQIRNILNRSNLGLPIGNLSSPLFGRSNSLAPSSGFGISGDPVTANRRMELQARLSF